MPPKKKTTTTHARKTVSAPVAPATQAPQAQAPAYQRRGPSTIILTLLLIVVSFFSGYLFFKVQNLEKQQGIAADQGAPARPTEVKIAKPTAQDRWRGNKNARYVWVEYSDLECPFCKKIHPDIVRLQQEYSGDLAWVFRHYPLSFHQNAQKESEAAECAAELGGDEAFWSYVDKIYERTTSNGTGFALTSLGPLAAELGLDQARFQQCLDSGKYAKKVQDQFNEGSKAGVQGTPANVIYDTKSGKSRLVEGAQPFESLKQALDEFIAQNK